jgi:hypothetical protein
LTALQFVRAYANRPSSAVLATAIAYVAITCVMGRRVLASLTTGIASDLGDPLLNAAILAWNATHVPWTDAWYQFPAFHPMQDALTFSEHLLGVSVLASPIYWLTGSAAAAYNLTLLLSYPLCGLAMYALVWRLTRSAPAAFLVGLAYAFAPYRVSQLPHIQVLILFWAPLALLGLHAYLETGRRRWLALFGACWLLQGAANGYYLVYFSVFVGLWGLWFVIAQGRWRELGMIVAAGLFASLPLLPIVKRYIDAHAFHGLSRAPEEIVEFSADISSVLCAGPGIVTSGWVGKGLCRPEGELFPGLALFLLCAIGVWAACRAAVAARRPRPLAVTLAQFGSVLLAVIGVTMIAAGVAVAVGGRWIWSIGPIHASASNVVESFSRGIVALLAAAALSPAMWAAVRTSSVPVFYALAAVICWVLAWGPAPLLYGRPALTAGPYAWLMLLPGLDGLRVPARFWMMTVLALCVVLGLALATMFARRTAWLSRTAVAVIGSLLILDGFSTIRAPKMPEPPPRADLLQQGVVLTLPLGAIMPDVAAQFGAVANGWSSVNGYSGYEPRHYAMLRLASAEGDAEVLSPILLRGDVHVLVDERSADHVQLVEGYPGVRMVAVARGVRQYWIPRQGLFTPPTPPGEKVNIVAVSVSCDSEKAAYALDGDVGTRWECGPQMPGQTMTADLGRTVTVGTVVPALGLFPTDFPRRLVVETSVDGSTWDDAWDGRPLRETIDAAIREPNAIRTILPFSPRPARYVRIRLASQNDTWYWSIAELEVWSGGLPD